MGLWPPSFFGDIALRLAGFPAVGIDTGGQVVDWPIARTDHRGGSFPPGSWRLRHDDYDVEWSVNEHGFRERPLTPKTAGEYRIGLLGDSFTAGYGVEAHERFGTLWHESLRRERPEATSWNFATGVMGTANAADVMRGVGQEYGLDEVILVFYAGNDLEDNRNWYEAELDDEGNPVPRRNDPWMSFREWGRAHSRVLSVVGSRALAALGAAPEPAGAYVPDLLERSWPYTERALDELLDAVGDRPLTIWYLPSDVEWDDRLWKLEQARFGYADEARFLMRDRLRRWADGHGVVLVDATPFLAGLSIEDVRFPRDPHWNVLGHRLVAQGLAADLRSAAMTGRACGARRPCRP